MTEALRMEPGGGMTEEVKMRGISLLLLGATLASCAVPPPPGAAVSTSADREFQYLVAGKAAGPPVSCMPTFNTNDMVVLNDSTVGFKSGGRVFVAHMQGGCNYLGTPGYALVTRQPTGNRLCSGEIATVVDVHNNFTVGSCSFGDFTPYTRVGR
jgi:hypothetical protein